ncbi:MAG: DNA repair protein RecO [Holosporales bacterium]|nr:DNA repair protein RecO [Holosporales bacterium]
MERRDTAILLAKHFYGEHRCHGIFLTHTQGRVRVTLSKKKSFPLQPGDFGQLCWKAVSSEKLAFGQYEGIASSLASILQNPLALLALKSACTLCLRVLPDHTPSEPMFHTLAQFLQKLASFHPAFYVLFECQALSHVGYGLSLEHCAVTGTSSGLQFVSPKTGRAVSMEGGGAYRERLLKLPAFLTSKSLNVSSIPLEDILQGILLTEHFWKRALKEFHPGLSLPEERALFVQYLY